MKAKELKWPFAWEERRPALSGRVLFVPKFYDKHEEWNFPGWDSPDFFGNNNPVCIEYCAGNGLWIAQRAKADPTRNWIAVEKKFERAAKTWAKIHAFNLPNLMVVCGEALTFTKYYLPQSCVEEVYVNFPDPWPKLRHAKNRLIQVPFANEIARIVKPKGKAIFATDDAPYCAQMSREMHASGLWMSTFPEPYYISEWDAYGNSYFDSLWREKGRNIHYLQFENKK